MDTSCGGFYLKKILLIILGFAILLLQSPVFASANNSVHKTIKVGYYENEIFQEGASEGEVRSGYAYEFYMKLSEYTGWRYEYVYGTYNDLYEMLVAGDIDVLAGIAYREERKEEIAYPDLPMGSESYVLVKHDFDTDITSDPSTLNGHTIGVLESNMSIDLDKYLQNHNIVAKVVLFDSTAELLDSFDSDEIDILAAESDGTNIREDAEVLLAYANADYYVCVNKGDSVLLKELNEAQNALFVDEPYYLSALNAKYFSSSLSSQTLSGEEKKWLNEHSELTIGYLKNYLPYSDMDEKGEVKGVVKDIVPKILNSLKIDGLKIKYTGFDNYNDMVAAVDAEEIDIAFPVAGGFYYSEENGIFQSSAILSSNTDLVYKNVVINPEMSTIAINNNNSMQYYFVKTNYPKANLVFYDSIEECLMAVVNGEVDCTTLNGLRASTILKNDEYKELSLRQLSFTDDRCMGIKIGNEGLLKIFNRGIHIMGSDYAENKAYKYIDDLYVNNHCFTVWDYIFMAVGLLTVILFITTVYLILQLKKYRLSILKLKMADNLKANFIDNMATNIRKPIADMAEDDENKTAKGLLSTVDNIIFLNHFDNGKVNLKEENINLNKLMNSIEESLRDYSTNKNISLQLSTNGIINKNFIADEAKLTQVLAAILKNSVQFTQRGGHISFDVTEKRSNNPSLTNMVFTIKDDGKGMSEEFINHIFEAYAKENPDSDYGNGLGLTIAKRIVDLMGGTITVDSVKDKGSMFVVSVPVAINLGMR